MVWHARSANVSRTGRVGANSPAPHPQTRHNRTGHAGLTRGRRPGIPAADPGGRLMRVRVVLLAAVAAVPTAARGQDAPPAEAAPELHWFEVNGSREPLLGLDLLVGQQTGIRPSLAVFRNERSAWVVEGFYGALLTRLGESEGAGVGVRWQTTRGGRDSVTFGPGVDVLFNFRDGQATFLAPTVDLAWRRDFGDRVGCVFGMNAGLGVGLSGTDGGRRWDRDPVAGRVTPLISVFGGLRF